MKKPPGALRLSLDELSAARPAQPSASVLLDRHTPIVPWPPRARVPHPHPLQLYYTLGHIIPIAT